MSSGTPTKVDTGTVGQQMPADRPQPPTLSGPGTDWSRRRARSGWLYAAPTAVFVVLFFIVPVLLVGQMSVSDWGLLAGNQGLNLPDNYTAAVDLRQFWPAIRFTLLYTAVTTVILLVVALGLALLIQESSKWKEFLRTSILVPSALGLAAASLLFYALYSQQSGPLSPLLHDLGLASGPVSFLGTPTAALWSTVALIVWRFAGFYMVLLLVGLQAIPHDMYEAAEVDGASRWQAFRSITLPLLRPSLSLCLILSITGSLLAFDQFYILTKGGPDGSTLTIVQLIYNAAFQGSNDLGVAAALSVMVLLVLVVMNMAQLRWLRGEEA
jgi:multiple sugar transport system permease protein